MFQSAACFHVDIHYVQCPHYHCCLHRYSCYTVTAIAQLQPLHSYSHYTVTAVTQLLHSYNCYTLPAVTQFHLLRCCCSCLLGVLLMAASLIISRDLSFSVLGVCCLLSSRPKVWQRRRERGRRRRRKRICRCCVRCGQCSFYSCCDVVVLAQTMTDQCKCHRPWCLSML